jgi:hypothetical protein
MKFLVMASLLVMSSAAFAEKDVAANLTRLDCNSQNGAEVSVIKLLRMSDEDGELTKLVLSEKQAGLEKRYAVQSVTLSENTPLQLTVKAEGRVGEKFTFLGAITANPETDGIVAKVGSAVSASMTRCSVGLSN